MKKLKVEVTREDEYEIEIDETIWTKKELADWSNTFHDVESAEELAETVAREITRQGYDNFIEGFGYINVFMENGYHIKHFENLKEIPEDELCKGIKVIIKDYDDYYSQTVTEIINPEKATS